MAEAPGTLEGWYVLHDFRRIDRAAIRRLRDAERGDVAREAEQYLRSAGSVDAGKGASAAYSIIGHKSDCLFLHLRPTLDELLALELALDSTRLAELTARTYSYLSVTELSLYEASARGGTEDVAQLLETPFVQRRLKPAIPDLPYVCFYPMNKRRGESVNWYTEGMDERRRMMRQHGSTGRKYHGRVTQMITGSMGLDDWEWGITLWAADPLDIKKLVYEMRFDEVSAKFAEFGPFQLGVRITTDRMAELLDSQR